jgi:hypothetical protein
MDGKELTIDLANRSGKSLLLIFSPVCKYCSDNWTYWHKLLEDARGATVIFGDVTANVEPEYFRKAGGVPAHVIRIGHEVRSVLNLGVTPMTIVLSPKGRVDGVWIGVLTDAKVRAVESLLAKGS